MNNLRDLYLKEGQLHNPVRDFTVLAQDHLATSTAPLGIFPSGLFRSPCGAPPSGTLDAGLHIDRTINYVNIPISLLLAKTNRELLHRDLDLQESSSAPASSLHRGVKGNSPHLCWPRALNEDFRFVWFISLFPVPLCQPLSPPTTTRHRHDITKEEKTCINSQLVFLIGCSDRCLFPHWHPSLLWALKKQVWKWKWVFAPTRSNQYRHSMNKKRQFIHGKRTWIYFLLLLTTDWCGIMKTFSGDENETI